MFKFAIITATHIRSPEGDLSSPFPVNERANNRARYAVSLLQQLQPSFTIHLGDMVHPLPHMAAYTEAVAEAKRIFMPLDPLHFVPGNHDIGDKPSPAMPAKPLSVDSAQTYETAFGASRYAFEHSGVVFLVINSSLVNSETDAEREQRQWLEQQLQEAEGKRIFLFSHYPPFIHDASEVDHYDNYAEPGRSWLLSLAVRYRVEVIFSGHVHQFFYNVYQGVKLVCLPPTSFIRQDYAELFATSPAPEYGRDDVNKYSVCQVIVQEQGFAIDVKPTFGREDTGTAAVPQTQQLPLIPHLRHSWFETSHLPYNGPMEEFGRKRARNDYPLLRLLQLGIDTVRIPLSDLTLADGLQRIHDWHSIGIRFVVFSVWGPDKQGCARLHEIGSALAGVEIVCVNGVAADDLSGTQIGRLNGELQCPVSVSVVSTSARHHDPSQPYAHSVSSGFECADVDQVIAELQQQQIPASTRVVFQLRWGTEADSALDSVYEKLQSGGYELDVNIRLSNNSPAVANFDDEAIAQKLKSVIEWAETKQSVKLQCDTYEDVDRGYHPRHGLIDRQGNIRLSL